MTKQKMMVKIRRAEEKAWLELAYDAYTRCPRISVDAMFEFQSNDVRQLKLRHAWRVLYELVESIGDVSDDLSDNIANKAVEYSNELYRECRAAEGRQ